MHEFHTCHIAQHLVPAIVNDDWSGLSDEDSEALQKWLDLLDSICENENLTINHFAFEQLDDPDFMTCSITLLWADCIPCTVYADHNSTGETNQ